MQLYPTGFDYDYTHEIKELLMEQLITYGRKPVLCTAIIHAPAIVLLALADGYMERINDLATEQLHLRITKKGMEFIK